MSSNVSWTSDFQKLLGYKLVLFILKLVFKKLFLISCSEILLPTVYYLASSAFDPRWYNTSKINNLGLTYLISHTFSTSS